LRTGVNEAGEGRFHAAIRMVDMIANQPFRSTQLRLHQFMERHFRIEPLDEDG
jgi:hypothetical protein